MKVKILEVSERNLKQLMATLNGTANHTKRLHKKLAKRLEDVNFIYGIQVVGLARSGRKGRKRVRLIYD